MPTPAPQHREPTTDTGRLFRSARASTDTVAVAAVAADQANRLRTLSATDAPAPIQVNSAEPRPAAALLVDIQDPAAPSASPAPAGEALVMPRERTESGVNTLGVYAVLIGATLIAGAIDIFVGGAGLGIVTGVVFLIASIFCALRVRRSDAAVAVIAPPIAFFIAAITVGQVGQSSTGGMLGRFVNTFFMLAGNWMWIIGATVVALVIVLVRGRAAN